MIVAPWPKSASQRLVCGVDLGAKGAFGLVDAVSRRIVATVPMPVYMKTVNNTARKRTDVEALSSLIDWLADMRIELLMCEDPGAGFGASGRQLGINVGLVTALAHKAQLRTEWVTAARWKKKLVVPSDKKESMYRCEALFPHDRDKIRNARGTMQDGLAEAAMVALYGIDNVLVK